MDQRIVVFLVGLLDHETAIAAEANQTPAFASWHTHGVKTKLLSFQKVVWDIVRQANMKKMVVVQGRYIFRRDRELQCL